MIDTLIEYVQLFSSFIKKEDQRFLIFEFDNLSDLDQRLPESMISKNFFSYTINHFHGSFNNLSEFLEEIETVHGGTFIETQGNVNIKIDKRKLLISLNDRIKNGFIFVNFSSIIESHLSIYPVIETELPSKSQIFIINDFEELYFENDYLVIADIKKIENQESIIINNIDKFNLVKSLYDIKEIKNLNEIPYFYHFENTNEILNPLKDLAIESFFYLISNKKRLDTNVYSIKGHHHLELKLDTEIININTQLITEILDFTLDNERHYDKLLILRNVLTTYLTNFSNKTHINQQLENIKATSQHHFELYIQNEIKIFIEQKNQVLNETLTLAKQVTTLTNDVTTNLRTVLLTLFAGIIASIFPQISANVSNKLITICLLISYIIYLVVNLFNLKFIKNQLFNSIDNFKNYTIYISSQSLHGLDFATLKEQFIKKEENNFNSVVTLSKVCIIILLIICSISLLIISKEYILKFLSQLITKDNSN
ncbi:hypothetical protein [Lysinibacillus xylanilyticus]|uniref:hypothetical protein n=1 Tax=Lysinibacillus xylanilyticus TaxID=582475 RepID=UPI003D97F1E8